MWKTGDVEGDEKFAATNAALGTDRRSGAGCKQHLRRSRLTALSDAIIPVTDTPGAKAALVNRFLDLVIAAEPEKVQKEFLDSLVWFDAAATEHHKTTFDKLTDEEKTNLLNLVAWPRFQSSWGQPEAPFTGYQHFSRLKAWISGAYYSSPVGLKEQGWDGWAARGTFTGCEHQPGEHKAT